MIKYRPEIDGLRAIAVLAVVFYHAELIFYGLNPFLIKQYGLNPFQGGFIGVDIFFVISGYLICSIILKGIHDNSFSFSYFYERRARRILPVLFFIIAISIPTALLSMNPKELVEFSGSILSTLGFGSNVWFWYEDSYTAQQSDLKPFLHTWSLSIEEQFYFFFPPLLLLVWRYAKKYLLTFLIFVFFISLQIADFSSSRFTDASFYLIHTRAWELIGGAILAKLEIDYGRGRIAFLDLIMPTVGIFLVMHSIIFFDDQMQHPSFITLIPILGTMILIWFCKKDEFISDILSSKIFVSIGLISYSLYLWHFPIFAFSKILEFDQSFTSKIIQILISFILAILSYFLIERPARNRNLISAKKIVSLLFVLFVILISIAGIIFYKNTNLMSSFSIGSQSFNIEYEKNKRFQYLHKVCPQIGWAKCRTPQDDKTNVLIVGDSMSIDAVNIISPIFKEFHYLVDDEFGGCPPHPNIKLLVPPKHPNLVECINKNKLRFSPDSLTNIDLVVINLLYSWYKPKDLIPYLEFLREIEFDNVIIFGNYITLKEDLFNIINKDKLNSSQNEQNIISMIDSKFYLQDELEKIANDFNYAYLGIDKYACSENCKLFIDGYPFTWDKFHFSLEFSNYLSAQMEQSIKNIIKDYDL